MDRSPSTVPSAVDSLLSGLLSERYSVRSTMLTAASPHRWIAVPSESAISMTIRSRPIVTSAAGVDSRSAKLCS